MDLLDRLGAVTIDRKGQLDEVDQAFCDKQERLFGEATAVLTEAKAKAEEIFSGYESEPGSSWDKDGYIKQHDDIRYLEGRLKAVREAFVRKMRSHFESRYNITVDQSRMTEALGGGLLTALAVVEEIFRQLGGASFAERAAIEIRRKLGGHLGRYNHVEAKGKRLIIDRLVWADKNWSWSSNPVRLSYHSEATLTDLLHALEHFESGSTELSPAYQWILNRCVREHQAFEKHDVGGTQVEAIRLFQNGKVEVTFASYELAARFGAEYTRLAA